MRDRVGAIGLRFTLTSALIGTALAVACGSSSDGGGTVNPGGAAGNAGLSGAGAGTAGMNSGGSSGKSGSAGQDGGATSDAGSPPTSDAGDAGAAGAGNAMAIRISPAVPPDARVGQPYTALLAVPGVASGLTWSLVGTPPPGLTLANANTAVASLQGTPTSAGVYPFSIEVKTDLGGDVVQPFTLRVRALPWLVYTASDGIAAVDLSSGTPGTPHVFSRALAAGEYTELSVEQPFGTQLVFSIVDVIGRSGWVTNFAGAAPTQGVRVNTPLNADSRAQYFSWSPDGRRLAWTANTLGQGSAHAYVADMTGAAPGAPVDVSGALTSAGSVNFTTWSGSSLFFSKNEPTAGPGGTAGSEQVAVSLSQFPPPLPVVLTDWGTEFGQPMANGTREVYLEQLNADTGAGELRVVGVGGTKPVQPVRLHAALTGTQTASYGAYLPEDGSFAVFSIDNYNGPNTSRLFRVRMNADGPLPAEPLTDGTQVVGQVTLSPDGKRVLYTLGQKALSPDTALYVSDVSGASVSAPVKINGQLVAGGSLFPPFGAVNASWSPDSQHVAYVADALQKGLREAFVVDVVNAPGNPKRLNTSLPAATSAVTSFRFSPDGRWIALYGDLDVAHVNGIYLVPLGATGPGLPQKVAETLAANEDLPFNVAWAPDASYFGYTVYNGSSQTYRAGVVALHDGTLSAPMPVGGAAHITSLQFLSAGF